MTRSKSALLAAVFASASLGSAAWAQSQSNETKANKGDATQVMPTREDLKPGAAPTVPRMDDNVQRQHDRDRGIEKPTGPGSAATASTGNMAPEVRDWDAIDTNNDGSIQPEEMEVWLKKVGPQAKQ